MLRLLALATALCACTGQVPDDPPTRDDSNPQGTDDTGTCADPCTSPSSATVAASLDASAWTHDVDRTRNNPLRGFMTSYLWSTPHNDFPHQLEYFYVPMSDVWGAEGETLESGLEGHLTAAADRGHHAVVRVYIDYPGHASGLPDHLVGQVPCQVYTEFGGGCSPDYDDPQLVDAMLGLIEAMGSRYDADPRLGFLQVGLIGFWGEWHTWPHETWFPTQETQTAVLTAFDDAFSTTQLQVRLPHANALSLRMGFHDDSFAYSTIGDVDWFFVPILERTGGDSRWQQVTIGGELRPELQGWVFDDDYQVGEYQQDFDACVQATHVTYLLNYSAFSEGGTGYVGSELERAEAAALTLGYQFELVGATLSASGLLDDSVDVQISVELRQTGVAPFYYPLALALDADGLPESVAGPADLQDLLPGESTTVVLDLGRVSIDVLRQPLRLSLASEMLLPGQEIALATATPWDPTATSSALQWALGCETDAGETVAVGQVTGTSAQGCDCRCDVDGQVRACDGAICP